MNTFGRSIGARRGFRISALVRVLGRAAPQQPLRTAPAPHAEVTGVEDDAAVGSEDRAADNRIADLSPEMGSDRSRDSSTAPSARTVRSIPPTRLDTAAGPAHPGVHAGRLIFANQLRGLAALSVLVSHLVGAFWAMREFLALATAAPPPTGAAPPALFALVSQPWLNFGPLGVGVFFLISGLVIPISLEHHSGGEFLLARAFRIYPTVIAALIVDVLALKFAAGWWQRPFPYGNWTLVSNGLLIYNLLGQPSVDLVNWTLCIELKFYLLMALLAPSVRRGRLGPLFLVAAAALAWSATSASLSGAMENGPGQVLIRALGDEALFIPYLLLGVLFNYRLRGSLELPAFFVSLAAMLSIFLASYRFGTLHTQFPMNMANYVYALAIFSMLFLARHHARRIRFVDFLADISFPLYLVHSLVGYVTLKFVMLSLHLPYSAALMVTIPTVSCVAGALHFLVEVPSTSLGKRLARARHSVGPAM